MRLHVNTDISQDCKQRERVYIKLLKSGQFLVLHSMGKVSGIHKKKSSSLYVVNDTMQEMQYNAKELTLTCWKSCWACWSDDASVETTSSSRPVVGKERLLQQRQSTFV